MTEEKSVQYTIENFNKTGILVVPYPENLRSAIQRLIQLWKDFCTLPLEVKQGIPYSSNIAGVGYEFKDGSGVASDKKENFDITTAWQEFLTADVLTRINNQTVNSFFTEAALLIDLIKPVVQKFGEDIEKEYELAGFKDEVRRSSPTFFLRFIHYFEGTSPEREIAAAHVDQSAFTLHLFESDEGFQYLDYESKDWMDVPFSDGNTVIIPAMQLQYRSLNETRPLRALCHRVIATETTTQTGRYSAVCFVRLVNTPAYNKDVGGRLQEQLPGFNYKNGISNENFAKLFA